MGGALAGAGVLWAAARSGLLVLPFFYPYLIGHLPWPITLCVLGVLGALGYAAWRHRARHRAVRIAGGVLALFAILVLFGRICQSSKLRWLAWHGAGAGLRAGMTRAEVEEALARRAKVEPCVPGGCAYAPRGLAGLAFTVFDVYGVDTTYGPDGKLLSWRTWSD